MTSDMDLPPEFSTGIDDQIREAGIRAELGLGPGGEPRQGPSREVLERIAERHVNGLCELLAEIKGIIRVPENEEYLRGLEAALAIVRGRA